VNASELTGRLERLLSLSKVGLLTTVDKEGFPHSRWMTPTMVKGRPDYLYAVTAPDSPKAGQIIVHPQVGWTFQSRVLDEIVSVSGSAELVVDPQLRAEVLEAIGPNLQIFWKVNGDSRNLVIVETRILEIGCFLPLEGRQYRSGVGRV